MMQNKDKNSEVYVSVWKQRLFELGIIVVGAIIAMEIFTDHVPLYVEILFVGLAVFSVLIQYRKQFCFARIDSEGLELYSPKLVGAKYKFPLSSIRKIEEIEGLYTTIRILLHSGKENQIILERFLGVCYSREVIQRLRVLFRMHNIDFEIRST